LLVSLPLIVVVAGCTRHGAVADNGQVVDINGAAEQAQGDIDTYRANALQSPREVAAARPPAAATTPSPSPSAGRPPLEPPAPGTPGGLPDDRTPVSEAPFTPESAQGAANVVQTYFALIEGGQFDQARALWGDGGKASGMSPAAFAASFARYAEYHANIGAPGRIDAGAGQRYVSVPVQVYGRLKDGGQAFNLRGDVSLHRTADVDGATAAQKQWRISAINLKPTSADAAPPLDPIDRGRGDSVPPTATADYRCDDGYAFHIVFDNRANTGTVSTGGKTIARLDAQRTASGIWYKGDGYELRGKGNSADFSRPGAPPVACTAG